MRILVAGGSGAVGREVARIAAESGLEARTLARSSGDFCVDALDRAAVGGVCRGVTAVVSCLGASVSPRAREKRPFSMVDTAANRNLIKDARSCGVKKFVYVAAHVEPSYADTGYIKAHEAVVADLARSGMDYAIIRPTGIYSSLGELVAMARRGMLMVIGDGSARTNPVHPADVALVCVKALADSVREVAVGGPDVFTRRQIVEAAFRAVGGKARIVKTPAAAIRAAAKMAGLFNPRLGELLHFVTAVSITDCIAPRTGTQRLPDYFADIAGGKS